MSAETKPSTYIRVGEIAELLGVAHTTVLKWRKEARANMPPSYRFGPKLFMWRRDEIHEWIERMKEEAA